MMTNQQANTAKTRTTWRPSAQELAFDTEFLNHSTVLSRVSYVQPLSFAHVMKHPMTLSVTAVMLVFCLSIWHFAPGMTRVPSMPEPSLAAPAPMPTLPPATMVPQTSTGTLTAAQVKASGWIFLDPEATTPSIAPLASVADKPTQTAKPVFTPVNDAYAPHMRLLDHPRHLYSSNRHQQP